MVKSRNIMFLFLALAIVLISLGFANANTSYSHYGDDHKNSSNCNTESKCNLTLTKSVDEPTAKVNEIVTYTLKYKNIGESSCTGGGVKIQDTLDEGLEYTGDFYTNILNDLDNEWIDSSWNEIPFYDQATNTLTWNAHKVSPGEEGTITFYAKVLQTEECGGDDKDYQIPNYFKAWSNEEGWKSSNIVNILIDNDCLPTQPVCGDNTCNGDETCSTCASDCGVCSDTTNPVVDITNPISTTYNSQITNLTFSVHDNNLNSCTYKLNSDAPVNVLSLIDGVNIITGVSSSAGSNTWLVTCIDDSGNTGSDSVTFTITIPLTCGDGQCNNGETCSTCASDCGVCPPNPPVCGNGIKEVGEECDDHNTANNDGCSSTCKTETTTKKSGKANNLIQFCDTNWKCSAWSECSNGIMTRNCVDSNNCDTEYNKPFEKNSCSDGVLSNVYVEQEESVNVFWLVVGIIILVVLLVILVNMFR